MRSACVFRLVAFGAACSVLACGGGKVQFFESENPARELSKTTVAASELTIYTFDMPLELTRLDSFPALGGAFKGWSVRTWSRELSATELPAVIEFLDNERRKYGTEGPDGAARDRIGRVRNALLQQPMDSALLSYLYKRNPPGTKEYQYGHWLYLYYFDIRTRTIVEITNAFR